MSKNYFMRQKYDTFPFEALCVLYRQLGATDKQATKVEVEVEVEVSRGLYRVGRRRRAIALSFYRGCPPLIGPRTALPCLPPRPS